MEHICLCLFCPLGLSRFLSIQNSMIYMESGQESWRYDISMLNISILKDSFKHSKIFTTQDILWSHIFCEISLINIKFQNKI